MKLNALRLFTAWAVSGALLAARGAAAQDATPNYLERVLQWTTGHGETCQDVARTLYGGVEHVDLVLRYNDLDCSRALPDGLTLIVPERVRVVPVAELRGMQPEVKARGPGSDWTPAASGMELFQNHQVNTFERARADILFVDGSRIQLSEHTLVVIYGSARASAVRREAAAVQLDEGEVMAGIRALGQPPLGVRSGSGEVAFEGRDGVVRKQGDRSTVSVFDGEARVTAKGKAVRIPERHGSWFTKDSTPSEPRPLPPEPAWQADTTPEVAWADAAGGVIVLSYASVPDAAAYRVELAQDAEFRQLLMREELPAQTLRFRAEHLPEGAYHVRVRAIDTDGFLGLAASRRVHVITPRVASGSLRRIGTRLLVQPYTELTLASSAGLELAEEGGPFRSCPCRVDLANAPRQLSLRSRPDAPPLTFPVDYEAFTVKVQASWLSSERLAVAVDFGGLAGIDIERRMQPRLRWRYESASSRELPLRELPLSVTGSRARALLSSVNLPVNPAQATQLEVVDPQGRIIGSTRVAPALAAPVEEIGPTAPAYVGAPELQVAPWSLAPRAMLAVGPVLRREQGQTHFVLRARARRTFGRFSVDAGFGDARLLQADASRAEGGFLGGAFAAWERRTAWGSFRWGPALRLSFPLRTGTAAAERTEGMRWESALVGEARLRSWELTGNLGARSGLSGTGVRYTEQLYALAWISLQAAAGAKLYSGLDISGFSSPDVWRTRAGWTLGGEFGAVCFANLAARLSPWDSFGGILSGQLLLGVRGP